MHIWALIIQNTAEVHWHLHSNCIILTWKFCKVNRGILQVDPTLCVPRSTSLMAKQRKHTSYLNYYISIPRYATLVWIQGGGLRSNHKWSLRTHVETHREAGYEPTYTDQYTCDWIRQDRWWYQARTAAKHANTFTMTVTKHDIMLAIVTIISLACWH